MAWEFSFISRRYATTLHEMTCYPALKGRAKFKGRYAT
jgi:hypothetical protein